MPVNVAPTHGGVGAATEGVGAAINARTDGAGCVPPVRSALVPGFQLVGVDSATVEPGCQDLCL